MAYSFFDVTLHFNCRICHMQNVTDKNLSRLTVTSVTSGRGCFSCKTADSAAVPKVDAPGILPVAGHADDAVDFPRVGLLHHAQFAAQPVFAGIQIHRGPLGRHGLVQKGADDALARVLRVVQLLLMGGLLGFIAH